MRSARTHAARVGDAAQRYHRPSVCLRRVDEVDELVFSLAAERSATSVPRVNFTGSHPPRAASRSRAVVRAWHSGVPVGLRRRPWACPGSIPRALLLASTHECGYHVSPPGPGSPDFGASSFSGTLSRRPQRAAIIPAISLSVWPMSCCSRMKAT